MKTTLYVMALAVCGAAAVCRGDLGTVYLGNHVTTGDLVDAPIYMPDGVTPVCGENFKAALFFEGGTTPETVVTTFYDCSVVAARGYFKSVSDAEVSGTLGGESVRVQLGVWDGTGGLGFTQAVIHGMSTAFPVTLGNAVSGGPPTLPAHLTELKSFALIPEPSAGAWCLLPCVLAVLLLRRGRGA